MPNKLASFAAFGFLSATTACGAPPDAEDHTPGVTEPNAVGDVAQSVMFGTRPLLTILMRRADGLPLGHGGSWYDDRVYGTNGGRNIVSYYSALSGNRFTFSRAGRLTVTDPETAAFDTRAGIRSTETDGVVIHAKRARLLAADAGFDYSQFDSNRDGTIADNELAILVIDKYSVALGATTATGTSRDIGCLRMSGVNVCNNISAAGHRSGLMNYAHELSHLLSPTSVDLYGAANDVTGARPCYSLGATLMSCTASGGIDDGVGAYFLDPWHRGAAYGWMSLSRHVTLSGASDGSEIIGLVGSGASGTSEMVELHGPNSESVMFEFRSNGANEYEDALTTGGVIAWYRQAMTNGQPQAIPSIQPNTTGTDKAVFTLASLSSCRLDMRSRSSRGVVKGLTGGSYRITWASGTDSGFLIKITPGFLSYKVSWSRTSTAPSC